jgi:hypothetical protein
VTVHVVLLDGDQGRRDMRASRDAGSHVAQRCGTLARTSNKGVAVHRDLWLAPRPTPPSVHRLHGALGNPLMRHYLPAASALALALAVAVA